MDPLFHKISHYCYCLYYVAYRWYSVVMGDVFSSVCTFCVPLQHWGELVQTPQITVQVNVIPLFPTLFVCLIQKRPSISYPKGSCNWSLHFMLPNVVTWKSFGENDHEALHCNTVCPQSPLGVLKNCGAQTNWASDMQFTADYSGTLEVFLTPTDWNKRPSLRFSVSCLKWRLCRNVSFVWDGFLRPNKSPRLNEMTAHGSISNLRLTVQ
jgi:hypothetical protein